jgi:hypothetical protein
VERSCANARATCFRLISKAMWVRSIAICRPCATAAPPQSAPISAARGRHGVADKPGGQLGGETSSARRSAPADAAADGEKDAPSPLCAWPVTSCGTLRASSGAF